jgi:hypothetical protein
MLGIDDTRLLIGFRFVLLLCYVLQAILFPNALTVLVPLVLIAVRVVIFWNSNAIRFDHIVAKKSYIVSSCLAVYSAIFYVVYTMHQLRDAPYMTGWIHPAHKHNYSFTESANGGFSNDVNDAANVYMREHPFTWPRMYKGPGVRINGTLPHAGPAGNPLRCGTMVDCYAANMAAFPTGQDGTKAVPMPSRFYSIDVMVTPRSGMMCKNLEIYRIVYNSMLGVEHSLDYPASSAPVASASYRKCNLFGQGAGWCLSFMHAFSAAEYNATVADKCTAEGGVVIFRLPARTIDVEPQTGRTALDAIIVSPGASVGFRYTWHSMEPTLLTHWGQWEYTKNDAIQEWRDSTDAFAVFIRHFIAILPLLILWYFLLVNFDGEIVQRMCIFILLPASIIFFSVGAWLPLTGTILCGIAINIVSATLWVRTAIYCCAMALTFAHTVYMTEIFASLGTNAFMNADSLRMVNENYKLGGYAFVSGSPAWITLTMPTAFCLNLFFCIGIAQTVLLLLNCMKCFTRKK